MNSTTEKKLTGGLRVRATSKNRSSEEPLVSIITVVLNLVKNGREGFFRKLINSVQHQDYGRQNIEHIVIDGGSTDGTLELIQEFDSKGLIDYWLSECDSGIYVAMNKGIRASTGSLLNFLNSDDYFAVDAVSASVNALVVSDADFSFGKALVVDESDCVIRERWMWALQYLYFGMPFCHQTMFIKRDWFDRVGQFDESYMISGDWDFVLRAFLRGASPVFVDRVLVHFRANGVSDHWAENAVAQAEKKILIKKNYLARTPFSESEICDLESFLMKPVTTHLDRDEIDKLIRKLREPNQIVLDFLKLLAFSIMNTRNDKPVRSEALISNATQPGYNHVLPRAFWGKARQVLRNFGI